MAIGAVNSGTLASDHSVAELAGSDDRNTVENHKRP